jgi:small subunit ribosomal protein S16
MRIFPGTVTPSAVQIRQGGNVSVKIRLKRMGTNRKPVYRIVVVDSRLPGKGRRIEDLGLYQPRAKGEQILNLDKEAAASWIKKGAIPSQSVMEILERQGVIAKGSTAFTA